MDDLIFHYKDELTHGLEKANARVARIFFEFATSGKHPMLTLEWMRMRAKWGAPAQQTSLTPEELEEETRVAREKLTTLLNREAK